MFGNHSAADRHRAMAVQGIWEVKFPKNVHWELEAGAHNTVWHRMRGAAILNKLWE